MNSVNKNEDLELLAALIDGRLAGEERARALKLLAESDEAMELFASAMRDQPKPEPRVVPISAAPRWRQWKVAIPVAAAAVLAVVMPRLVTLGGGADFATQFAMDLTRVPSASDAQRIALSPGWEQRGWSRVRGVPPGRAGVVRYVVASKPAFRLGVRTVDVQVALRRGDTANAGRLTDEIVDNLTQIDLSQPMQERYSTLRRQLASVPLLRAIDSASSLGSDLRDFLRSDSFVFGQWVGAADLAAQTHDVSFFASKNGLRYIQSKVPADSLAAGDTAALRFIDARVRQASDDRAMDEVRQRLQEVIRRRGS
jgi:hypothetical protein